MQCIRNILRGYVVQRLRSTTPATPPTRVGSQRPLFPGGDRVRRALLLLLKALGFAVLAVLWVWFVLPQRCGMHYRPTPPELAAFYEEKRKKRRARLIRQAFEQWQRQENETRTRRVWENRNDFYKKGRKK